MPGSVDAHARHCGERRGAEWPVRLAQRAVRFGGQAFHGGEDLLAIALRHRSYGTVDRDAAAVAEQYIGGTLGEDGETPGIGVVLRDDGHAFAVGGEWNLADARVVGVFAIGLHLACGDDKRHFGRVADGFPRYVGSSGTIAGTCVFAQFAVVGQRAGHHRHLQGSGRDVVLADRAHRELRGVELGGEGAGGRGEVAGERRLEAELVGLGADLVGAQLHAEVGEGGVARHRQRMVNG